MTLSCVLGVRARALAGSWVASAKCVTHTCQVAVLEVYMIVELCRKDPKLGQRMMRVLAYASVRAQREVVMAKGRCARAIHHVCGLMLALPQSPV